MPDSRIQRRAGVGFQALTCIVDILEAQGHVGWSTTCTLHGKKRAWLHLRDLEEMDDSDLFVRRESQGDEIFIMIGSLKEVCVGADVVIFQHFGNDELPVPTIRPLLPLVFFTRGSERLHASGASDCLALLPKDKDGRSRG
ncbi:hypothetical protein MPTK1_2g05550 [Marchantia polymorpha subsp. ruderalis]|nr:hypothetical protein MARPO_0021s0011 [Marchantia polymorpha]BBN01205.1 hypothetical protein Mp_2g05550 [Marchantia polymorpha subsp. ruderalis]|eukprot:PTQ44129.1 hypothetical protein MARPO_0021s0011 [Marchantia polymorpha]